MENFMDYVAILLSIMLAFFMVLLALVIREKTNMEISKDSEIEYQKAKALSNKQQLTTALEREAKARKELKQAYNQIEQNRIQRLKNLPNKNGYTSKELKENLRFLLPDNEIANNVKVKVIKEGDNIVRIESTVRKKVKGKFTDVTVEPVFAPVLE